MSQKRKLDEDEIYCVVDMVKKQPKGGRTGKRNETVKREWHNDIEQDEEMESRWRQLALDAIELHETGWTKLLPQEIKDLRQRAEELSKESNV